MKKKKSRKIKRFIFISLIILIIGLILVGIDFYLKTRTPYAGYGDKVVINVEKGASVTSIARLLAAKNIISNYYYFRIYYKLFYNDAHFISGDYLFDRPITMKEVIEKLAEGKVLVFKITIKEGLIIKEIAETLGDQPNIKIDADEIIRYTRSGRLIRDLDSKADDLEGYLFPDTYLLKGNMKPGEIVELMVNRLKEKFTDAMKWRARELKLSIRQVMTLASLIEKESANREERFLISSVFHNRLKEKMLLDCDPTIIYALKRENRYKGKLGWADLEYDSPYNTRKHRGLPPGPICNPGLDSIEAALYPENTNYLYFVAKDPHTHYFSETLDEHNRAVYRFIKSHPKNTGAARSDQ